MIRTYKTTDEKFSEAKKLITSNGGIIYTDGSFSIKGVEGEFVRDGNLLQIKITDKPILASWEMIGNKLDDFFS